MRLYLDVSSLNRPFDDQSQERIRLEAEAVLLIMERIDRGDWQQISSDIATREVNAIADVERRNRVRLQLPPPADTIALTQAIRDRGQILVARGLHPADALHVAAAETGGADVLLTCDDRLIRWGRRNRSIIETEIANPLSWLESTNDATDA